MGRTHSGEPPYSGPERRHPTPCGGLVEIQIASARADAAIEGIQEHFRQQNGGIQHIGSRTDRIEAKQDAAIVERQRQIDAVQRQIVEVHTGTLDRFTAVEKTLAARDRQLIVLLSGILVTVAAPLLIEAGKTLLRLVYGG